MTDPIADMLTRIRNAQMVKKSEVTMPYSKLKFNILNLLQKQGWIGNVEKIEPAKGATKIHTSDITDRFATLKVIINYDDFKNPKINSLKRISKPGRRVYVSQDEIPVVLNGKGMLVISSSLGLLTDKEAKQKKVGGEIICEIY